MTPRTAVARRRAVLATPALAALVMAAAAGCGGRDGSGAGSDPPTSVTLPSSLSVPATGPGGGPATSTTATTVEVPPTNPAAEGAPVITSLRAEPSDPSCPAGATPVTVTFTVEPEPPVRVFTFIVDGTKVGASNDAQPATVGALPCDGAIHSVLFIATGFDALSSTQAVAVRAPGLP